MSSPDCSAEHTRSYGEKLCLRQAQQSLVPAHPMAPPSPSTTSSNNNSSSSSNSGWDQLSKTNLYIRGLPPNTTDQDLVKLCQP
ncbi:hypothetical protein J1605_008435 [Eschrichtius robustus]|uniref:RNA-binding motif, single-stranded-interacting protein 3 n=1 Tax=Eschrichtius robustus TaxID=9764 RepID=A0AB34GXU1_ESCRO|nr:hypothetical protein J1605_008435 [Eschrichtius robustus]